MSGSSQTPSVVGWDRGKLRLESFAETVVLFNVWAEPIEETSGSSTFVRHRLGSPSDSAKGRRGRQRSLRCTRATAPGRHAAVTGPPSVPCGDHPQARPRRRRRCRCPELPTRKSSGRTASSPANTSATAHVPPSSNGRDVSPLSSSSDTLSRPGYRRYASLTPITAATAARRVIQGGPNQMHANTTGTPTRAVRTRWSSTRFTLRRYGPGCPGSRTASAFDRRRSARDPNRPRPGPAKAPACGSTRCRPPAR